MPRIAKLLLVSKTYLYAVKKKNMVEKKKQECPVTETRVLNRQIQMQSLPNVSLFTFVLLNSAHLDIDCVKLINPFLTTI